MRRTPVHGIGAAVVDDAAAVAQAALAAAHELVSTVRAAEA
jgi:hypothetical protein